MKGIGVVVLTGLLIASTLARDFAAGAPQFDNSTSGFEQKRTLSFADRVAYQYAIEEVYWRHRIWPKENSGSKPALDAVMSAAQIEKKVEDYLRNSQLLAVHWQGPITQEQLQAEMERMASQTKQPEVLQELFAVLGNDPFLIAECLARPVLSERLVKQFYAHDERIHADLKRKAEFELRACRGVKDMKRMSGTYSEIERIRSDDKLWKRIVGQPHRLPPDSAGGAPALQQQDSPNAIRMSSGEWGESIRKLAAQFSSTVSCRARPERALSNAEGGAQLPRQSPDALESITAGVLGALQEDETHFFANAVVKKGKDRLKVATVAWPKEPFESWAAKAEIGLLKPVDERVVDYTLPAVLKSLPADPSIGCTNDTWTPMFRPYLPDGRRDHRAVWTGTEMIIWGGYYYDGDDQYLNTGAKYDPSTDSWSVTSIANAPAARNSHTAVWTGSEMIVWGGYNGSYLNTGGRYNPSTNNWIPTTTTNAPGGRSLSTAIWTGSEMIIWGGRDPSIYLSTGGRYNPSTDSWAATSSANAPTARGYHTAVWTGSEMIVWGGLGDSFLTAGGRYNPGADSWNATTTTNAPAGRVFHTAVWTGSQMIVWGGYPLTNTGGKYDLNTNSWVATSIANAPAARTSHSAVWTGSEMIVWSGDSGSSPNPDTGGRYNPNTNSWVATSISSAPAGRTSHSAVWTGSEMIVWGGYSDNDEFLSSGGRYNPSTDSWIATNSNGPPDGRYAHAAVWTGSEMIIWGGNRNMDLNSGGRYNPSTDSWVSTSTNNAPTARTAHRSVWTGSEMIVWGGYNGIELELNSGGRYNPSTDSWIATSISNAPSARASHSAVWTGIEMIVWGGRSSGIFLNTGGRYNPSTNSWVATTAANAPDARFLHTVIWTGSEMIVWGGRQDFGLSTGGRYNLNTNSWVATSMINAPIARTDHTAIWTGSEMIVWGGFDGSSFISTGGRYSPITDTWVTIATAQAARADHTAVWTGGEMIVWGGYPFRNDGERYNPSTDSWIATTASNAPTGREFHTAVWTGSEMIVWGGFDGTSLLDTGARYCASSAPIAQSAVSRKVHGLSGAFNIDLPLTGMPGIECRAGGATNDYSIVVTFASAVTVNGSPQAQVASGTGTVGSGGVSNGGMVTMSGNSVTVPLTNVANAQTINVRLNGVTGSSGSGNITIPMSILIADTNANGAVNSGDVAQTKARIGQTLDATNFRSDVNANGAINAGDVSQIKSLLGMGLP